MEAIWSQSSVSFRTGCRSSHCIKAEQMVRMKRRMKRRDWWENTRYCGWTVVCLSVRCLSEKCSWIHTLHPQGSFLVYPIDSGDEEDTKCQITSGIPKNSAIKVLVRVYIVKVPVCLSVHLHPVFVSHSFAQSNIINNVTLLLSVLQATNLAPTDPNGKADPYLVVRAGQQILDTKDRYIPKQLNPTFGESVPVSLPVPVQYTLTDCLSDSLHVLRYLSGCLNSQCLSRWIQSWLLE